MMMMEMSERPITLETMSQPLAPYLPEEDNRSCISYQLIVPSILQDKKLRIPEKFVKKFGDELCDVATLKAPNGRVWQVGLTRERRKIWFNDGWHDFVKYHSICVGHFLVFEYAKNSTFDVLIFDMSACEIEYPCNPEELENEELKSIPKDDMESEDKASSSLKRKVPSNKCEMEQLVEIDESRQGKVKGHKRINLLGSLHSKRCINAENFHAPSPSSRNLDFKLAGTKFKTTSKAAYEAGTDSSEDDDEVNKRTKLDEHEFVASLEEMGIYVSRAHEFLSVEESQRVIHAVKLYKPKNPSFMGILRSKKTYSSYMYVPPKFANKYLNKVNEYIKIQDPDGREWPVQLRRFHWCGITVGWRAFSKEKNLKLGDICLFELIRTESIVLKVSVLSHTSSE